MSAKSDLITLVQTLLASPPFGDAGSGESAEITLETPKDPEHGDLAYPCFGLAKQLRKAPPQIAKELAQLAQPFVAQLPAIDSISAAGPYLNFKLNLTYLAEQLLPQILSGEFLAPAKTSNPTRVMVEYSQPNTHKAFHVGHCRCATLGDSLVRILEWNGGKVTPVNYIGDEGTHVARCIWYLLNHHDGEFPAENRGEHLGMMYTRATELLSLDTLTKAPVPDAQAAKVAEVKAVPSDPELTALVLESSVGRVNVITRAKGAQAGSVVAFIPVGGEFNGKKIEPIERQGVVSTGFVLSEAELGISKDNSVLALMPDSAKAGDSVMELFKVAGAVPEGRTVAEEHKLRLSEVSKVLQAMESGDGEIHELWKKTRTWSLEEFKDDYGWLNCRFDHYFYESEFGARAKEVARKYEQQGIFVQSQGSLGADLKTWGLGFCILIKRDGTATYAARDIALAERKFSDFGIERALYIVDAGQTLHFQQVFKCLELMQWPQAANCKHLPYAQVVRPDGKMSSRKGNVILFSELKRTLIERVRMEFLESYRGEWEDSEIEEAAYKIALATIRYGMLNQDNNTQIVFDLESWTAKTGNTGPYLLYACARVKSILREASTKGLLADPAQASWSELSHPHEQDILRHLAEYRTVVEGAASELSPHLICSYAYELARKFSRWYQSCSVMNADSAGQRAARLALASSVSAVIEHALGLIGIKSLERM